jgi:glucose/arabinose dehydrogenase
LKTLYTVDNGYNFQDPGCALGGQYYLCWPTVAPSSLDFYTANENSIPGWENSLLMPTLKRGTLYRLKLSSDRRATVGDAIGYFKTPNRYRDIALSPDKRTLYLCTDSEGVTSGAMGGNTATRNHPGAILEFRYTGLMSGVNVPAK